jgi:hypothetical protein
MSSSFSLVKAAHSVSHLHRLGFSVFPKLVPTFEFPEELSIAYQEI